MEKLHKLVVLGNTAFAEIAYEYFTHDSPYTVVGFSVDEQFMKQERIFGLPVVPLNRIQDFFDPPNHAFYAASTYTQLNRLRTRFYSQAKALGYRPASYVSSQAFVWRNVAVGEHCFIFENNVVQPFCRLGDNVVLWSGNHIGHHSTVKDNVFISSHVVVSGFCEIGENSFLGVNSTISNNVTIAADNLIGAGVTVLRHTQPGQLYGAKTAEPNSRIMAKAYFKVPEDAPDK